MRPTKIQNLTYKMLAEGTGLHMLDSGGGEGRHWQKNQKRTTQDFMNDPEVDFDSEGATNSHEVAYTISVFHYLSSTLELDELCDSFNKKRVGDWDGDTHGVSASGQKWLEKMSLELGDTFNTYNGESSLSQVLQGTICERDCKTYVLLQIHNGCDVRGGYTDAKLFLLENEYMKPEDVYGTIGDKQVDNQYDGYHLGDDQGKTVKIKKGEKIELYIY